MTKESFTSWLKSLKKVWEEKNPEGAIELCADEFLWHETSFNQPLTTKEQLLNEWKSILDQENIQVSYDVLSVAENIGIAHWSAKFIRLTSKEKVELDGIFMVSLNEKGLCIEFRQWYNIRDESTTKG